MASSNKLDAFLTPTTCFTVACVACSLIALSTIWRNSKTSQFTAERSSLEPALPRRRDAADSLYPETKRQQEVAELVSLCARVAQLLRACQNTSDVKVLVVELLAELSTLTTTLCRLHQQVLEHPNLLDENASLAASFATNVSSLQATMIALEASLSSGIYSQKALQATLQQLQDRRPFLDSSLVGLQPIVAPPTPPPETWLEFTPQKREEPLLSSLPLEAQVSTSPGTETRSWSEPPPEYSPPADDTSVSLEKVDEKPITPETPMAEALAPELACSLDHSNALYDAVAANDIDRVAELLDGGADPSFHFGELQRTVLHHAAHLNNYGCISILLRHGALIDAEDGKGDTALHLAAWAGNVEALSTLLSHGADVDFQSGRDSYSPLWCSVSACQIDAARLLLKHGARVSLRSATGGLTPLHQAAVTGQGAMCELLLERGAQVDCRDDDQNTALHYAAASGSVAAVKTLLQQGVVDIEPRQSQGLTPVHWAAHKGHSQVLVCLLDHGANPNSTTDEGAAPLHLAANRGHAAAVRVLLEKGAARQTDRAEWDGMSGTPVEMARAKGHMRVVRLLKG